MGFSFGGFSVGKPGGGGGGGVRCDAGDIIIVSKIKLALPDTTALIQLAHDTRGGDEVEDCA